MEISPYRVSSGKNFKLKHFFNVPAPNSADKKILKEQLQSDIEKIKKLQDLFFAYDRCALLLLFQGMDAAGKDGAIKHVMSGINPQGVQVIGFRAPSPIEYKHDFLWRHHHAMPERGRIGIHNRSHYEFVTTCKVHPEFVLKENLPGIHSVKDLNKKFWKQRYEQIRQFESTLTGSNLVMLKFYLHLSKEEQKKRLIERIDRPDKNWKFEAADLHARKNWDDYIKAYETAIQETATDQAPWYIIPADDKWFARALIAKILKKTLEQMNMQYPKLSTDAIAMLHEAREKLRAEK